MTLRERVRWFGRMVLLLFILGSAAFLSAITTMRLAIQGRVVDTPDLVGKDAAAVRTLLASRGLGMVVADHVFSNLPVDTVVRQSPPPGLPVKVGERAHVVLSLGPQRVNIPTLTDRSLRAARIELLSLGLQLGEVSSLYLPEEPPDVVVEQDPLPGTAGAESPKVALLVSLGARSVAYVMPNLVGIPLGEAERKLSATGLKVAKVTPVSTPGAAAGSVVAQTPARGSRVDETTPVELQVAQ